MTQNSPPRFSLLAYLPGIGGLVARLRPWLLLALVALLLGLAARPARAALCAAALPTPSAELVAKAINVRSADSQRMMAPGSTFAIALNGLEMLTIKLNRALKGQRVA